MGKLIAIIGNNASGKTTLTQALCQRAGFRPYLESHVDRPYQTLFAQDVRRYAFRNQVDYLLARAEQEVDIRSGVGTGVQDGGLGQDFNLYTRLFHCKGYLDEKEYLLCERMYQTLRASLPAPDLIVWLKAPLEVLRQRLIARGRTLDLEQIVTLDDLPVLESYLQEWAVQIDPASLLALDQGEQADQIAAILARLG